MTTVDQLERRPPATEAEVSRLVSGVHFELSPDYLDFLRESNGAEGTLGSAYVVIWSTDQIFEMNDSYHVREFAPHLFLFGSDGAGEAYAFDTRTTPATIVMVPFIGFDEEVAWGNSFRDFLRQIGR